MQMAARITDIRTSGELDALRTEVAVTDLADQFQATVDAYCGRVVAYTRRRDQDSTALHYMIGDLGNYLRNGGDPEVARIVGAALEFAATH